MDAKARLANLLDRIVECEAERRVALTKRDDARADNWEFRREQARSEALALLDTEPVPPPQPAGPVKPAEAVTSEEAAEAFDREYGKLLLGRMGTTRMQDAADALDATMPLLARDHGYVKLSEVERRAREWAETHRGWAGHGALADGLVAALTREAK